MYNRVVKGYVIFISCIIFKILTANSSVQDITNLLNGIGSTQITDGSSSSTDLSALQQQIIGGSITATQSAQNVVQNTMNQTFNSSSIPASVIANQIVAKTQQNIAAYVSTSKSLVASELENETALAAAQLQESVNSAKQTIQNAQETLKEELDGIKTQLENGTSALTVASKEILEKLESAMNLGFLEHININDMSEENKAKIASAFLEIGNGLVENGVSSLPSTIMSQVLENQELKEQAQAMLDSKIDEMKQLGVDEDKISAFKDLYQSTLGSTLEHMANGDLQSAAGTLVTAQGAVRGVMGDMAQNLVASNQDALTAKLMDTIGLQNAEARDLIMKATTNADLDKTVNMLISGDLDGAKQAIKDTGNATKELIVNEASQAANSIVNSQVSSLLEKVGLGNTAIGGTLSGLAGSLTNKLTTGIANLFKGTPVDAKQGVTNIVTSVKDEFQGEALQEKTMEVVGAALQDANLIPKIDNSLSVAGESLKQIIASSAIADTVLGSALENIINKGVEQSNEEVIVSVNAILNGDIEEGILRLKNSAIDLTDSSVAASFQILNTLIESAAEKVSEKLDGTSDKLINAADNLEQTVNQSNENLTNYMSSISSDSEHYEENSGSTSTEQEDPQYNIHESNFINSTENEHTNAHHQAALSNAKATSNGSD